MTNTAGHMVVIAADVLTHEDTMNLVLITVPTILLAVVTVWSNDRMYQLAKQAIQKLSRKKVVVVDPATVVVEFHGRHERVEEEHPEHELK